MRPEGGNHIRSISSATIRAGGDRPPHRRNILRGTALLAVLLSGLLALDAPAGAQDVPDPTPTPTPSPSPTPDAAPAPLPPPPPTAAPGPSREDPRPERHRQKGHRRQKGRRNQDRRKGRPVRIKPGCAPFSFTQTYITWGPGLAYDEPVTVVYEASRCVKQAGTAVELSVQGTATVYQGILVEGAPIDSRPFSVTGIWDRPTNPEGWPPPWWECGVKQASYTWDLAGMYTFRVVARWGVWTLNISTQGTRPDTMHWAYNGCA